MKKLFSLMLVSLFVLVSCSGNNGTDIINPESDFLYFYGSTCPHCQELNKRVTEEDLFSQISVEKREVYYNNVNRELFLAATTKLGLDESKVGVPFVMDRKTGEYAVGVEPALALFKTRVGQVITEEVPVENNVTEDTTDTMSGETMEENSETENVQNDKTIEEAMSGETSDTFIIN